MLKLEQIQGDLLCIKLGNEYVGVEPSPWDESIGVVIKDGRFEFIKQWMEDHGICMDIIIDNMPWFELQQLFHKYIHKALAKQGIKNGANIIKVGKKSFTVDLNEGNDEYWWEDTFGAEHKIDVCYNVAEHVVYDSYGISLIMNSVIDHDQLLVDYLLYSDNLIKELKLKLRQLVVQHRNDCEEFEFERYTINQLGMQFLLDECNHLLKQYEETA